MHEMDGREEGSGLPLDKPNERKQNAGHPLTSRRVFSQNVTRYQMQRVLSKTWWSWADGRCQGGKREMKERQGTGKRLIDQSKRGEEIKLPLFHVPPARRSLRPQMPALNSKTIFENDSGYQ